MSQHKAKKVLIGITKSNFGGAQRYVLELAKAARAAGHDVAVLCGGEGVLVDKLTAEGIRIIPLPVLERNVILKRDYKNFFSIYHILKDECPDIFHLNSSKMGGLGSLAARVVRIPQIIFTAHSFEFNAPRPEYQKSIFKFLYWLIVMFSHEVICVSERGLRDLARMPFTSKKLTLIHNGIAPFPLLSQDEARKKLVPNLSSPLIIGTLAELHKVKGLDILFRAFAQMKDSAAHLVVLGEGEERESLTELTEDLQISDQVHLLGYMERAPEYLKAFDIFALPSRSEGLPYALLEAGMAGLPVVASRVGGIPEVIEDSQSGYLVPAENPYFLSKALKDLTSSSERRQTFGTNLHNLVSKEYNQKDMLKKTLDLYATELEEPKNAAENLPVSPEQATQ